MSEKTKNIMSFRLTGIDSVNIISINVKVIEKKKKVVDKRYSAGFEIKHVIIKSYISKYDNYIYFYFQ